MCMCACVRVCISPGYCVLLYYCRSDRGDSNKGRICAFHENRQTIIDARETSNHAEYYYPDAVINSVLSITE